MQLRGFIIIVAAVASMMAAMVLLVMNFNQMSATRTTYTSAQAEMDSLRAAEVLALHQSDSILSATIQSQALEIAALRKQIANVKYRVTLITE